VTPPIAGLQIAFSSELAADIEDAASALVRFDLHAVSVLGIDDPSLGPLSAILLRTESTSSSNIEQLTTSAKQLALAEIDESSRQNALSVIGNVRAMEAAVDLAERLDASTILAMHRALMEIQFGAARIAGRFREQLVWIGGSKAGPRGASYVAPQHRLIPGAIDDLIAFVERDDIPVLAQVAIAHAQFESVHPFADGNGRTGRALAQSMLRNKDLVSHTTVPLSAGLLRDVEPYFAALDAYRAGDAAPVIRAFADAARFAAASGRRLVDDLADVVTRSRERIAHVRPQAAAWSIIPRLVGQPVVNLAYLRGVLGLPESTALRAMQQLTDAGVLEERSGRHRNRVWQQTEILDVLDAYAASIRRGGGMTG
jgi:Fic family protein